MENKNFTVLFILIAMLAVCILLMGISLLMSERVFGQVKNQKVAVQLCTATFFVMLIL